MATDRIHDLARPFNDPDTLDTLIDRMGDASHVLLGDASHGTRE